MTTYSTVDLRTKLSEVLGRVNHGHERIIVTKSGKPVAGIIPYDELLAIQEMEEDLDRAALEEGRKEGRFHKWTEVKKELGLE